MTIRFWGTYFWFNPHSVQLNVLSLFEHAGMAMARHRIESHRTGFLDGSRRAFVQAGARISDPRWAVLNLIEPAAWKVEKTEAIDPASDFWWLDDDPSEHDRDWLREHDRENRLIEVSSDLDLDALVHETL